MKNLVQVIKTVLFAMAIALVFSPFVSAENTDASFLEENESLTDSDERLEPSNSDSDEEPEPFHHDIWPGVSKTCEAFEPTKSISEEDMAFVASDIGDENDVTICEECVDNTDGTQVTGQNGKPTHTRDNCVINAPGAICGHGQDGTPYCCDWDKAGKGRQCLCNTNARGKCPTHEACAACMLIAEAGGEPKGDCQLGVICTFKNRAKKLGIGLCETLHSKSGRTGDGPAFDSSKCICDRVDPAPNTGYNQNYCDCCERGTDYPGYSEALKAVQNADCSKSPFDKVTFFNANGRVPCKGGKVNIGDGKCGHNFFACKFP